MPRRSRRLLNTAIVVLPLVAAGLAFYCGLLPGSSFRITVDHCYVTYSMQEVPTYSCDGHWSRAFRSESGPVYGVDASRLRSLEEVDPSAPATAANGAYLLVVPDKQRERLGVADPFHAVVLPDIVAYLLDFLVLVTVLVWLACVHNGLRPQPRDVASDQTAKEQ